MELTETERLALELVAEANTRARNEMSAREVRFMRRVSERVGIPVEHLQVNMATGTIIDRRLVGEEASDVDAS